MPGLKTGVENDIFWSEMGLEFKTGRYTPAKKSQEYTHTVLQVFAPLFVFLQNSPIPLFSYIIFYSVKILGVTIS